jgi:5'-deoxynucleotidase YfbR-like HD superfamily hydrolase
MIDTSKLRQRLAERGGGEKDPAWRAWFNAATGGHMKKRDIIRDVRLAGQVRRYHTWPCIHHQTVAEHTWQVMRLYVDIFGAPPAHVFVHMIFHDVAEIQTGDIPYPVKKNSEALKKEMDRLEEGALRDMGVYLPILSFQEHARFKFCDLLDCAEQGQYEANLGNQYMGTVADQREGLNYLIRKLDEKDASRARSYCVGRGIQLDGEEDGGHQRNLKRA